MQKLVPGLRRWTSWHEHWQEEVGSVAVDTSDGLVLIDPLAPPPELAEPEHVLPSHGHPVLEHGTRELARVLATP